MRRPTQIAALTLLSVCPALLSAQQTPAPPARYTIELETRQRWMNARQLPLHTPNVRSTYRISIDSIVTDSVAGTRNFWSRTAERGLITDPARLTTRLDGHVVDINAPPRALPAMAMMRTWRDSARFGRTSLLDFSGVYLALPAARVWDAIPVFKAGRLRAGERWVDTISYAASVRDMQQSMTGRRTFTIVRDTTVTGAQFWIVRDSATVDLTERFPSDERRLDTLATIERRATGFIVGRSLYDPGTGLFRARADSTALKGEATLRYPDGRVFRTPTRLERGRQWTLYEPAELVKRDAQIAAQRDSNSFSIVSVPRNAFEEKLAAGHKPTLDSLYGVWLASRDPDVRADIKQLLMRWGTRDSIGRARFYATRAAEGDTSYLLGGARYDENGRITLRTAQMLLPVMRDPGLAFQYGVSRDLAYERVVETLIRTPPAIEPDSSKWLCEPAACRLLGDQWRSAVEPRLRSVGLAVLTLVNPRQWRDTFLIRAKAGDNVLQLALPIVDGAVRQGGLSAVAVPNPVPPPSASWEAWRDWVRGPNPQTLPTQSGRGALPPQPPRWLMSGGNTDHLRFFQVATGRNLADELRRLLAAAPSDTAMVLLSNILVGLKALPFDTDTITAFALHANPLLRSFAVRLIVGSFPSNQSIVQFARADSATGAAIHRHLLTAITSKREPWPSIDERLFGGGGAGPFREPPSDAPGAQHPIYYDVDSVDAAVRAEWTGRLTTMSDSAWTARSSREGGELWSISRVDRAGRFARVSVQVSGRIQRAANQGPQAWYSWTTYYLIERNGEWLLLTKSSAVT